MKNLLITEAISAALLLIIIIVVIQMAACGKKEKILETEAENTEIRISKDLWLYAGEISSPASPLKKDEKMGNNIWGLCFSNLYLDAKEIKMLSELGKFEKGKEAFQYYKQINEEENKTYLTIKINTELKTPSDAPITADDLLFNYYFRCDFSAEEVEEIAQGIDGGMEYYYGTDRIDTRKKEIENLLKTPSADLQNKIKEKIIKPELEREYQWVETLFEDGTYQELIKGYENAGALFSHYYAYQTSYAPEGKSKEEILSDIAAQYGANYRALEKVTGRSYQTLLEKCALMEIWKNEKKDTVREIRGLKKIDVYTVQIAFLGTDVEIEKYLDIWILPLKNYGLDASFADGSTYILKKGGAASVYETAKKYFRGSGAYYSYSLGGDSMSFYKNPYYYKIQSGIGKIYIRCNQGYTAKEIVENMLERKLDMAVFPVDEASEKLIKNRGTGAAYKLALLSLLEETEYGILYRTDYINATTFPKEALNIRQIFSRMGVLEVNR